MSVCVLLYSERSDAAGTSGQRLKEGGSINRSLVTLGSVISTLGIVDSSYCYSNEFLCLTGIFQNYSTLGLVLETEPCEISRASILHATFSFCHPTIGVQH